MRITTIIVVYGSYSPIIRWGYVHQLIAFGGPTPVSIIGKSSIDEGNPQLKGALTRKSS